MCHTAFAIATDGSNDTDTKLYPVVERYYNSDLGEVVCHLLALPSLAGNSTGENIAGLLNETMERLSIPWKNCISVSCDNAAVMIETNKGVTKFLKDYLLCLFMRILTGKMTQNNGWFTSKGNCRRTVDRFCSESVFYKREKLLCEST